MRSVNFENASNDTFPWFKEREQMNENKARYKTLSFWASLREGGGRWWKRKGLWDTIQSSSSLASLWKSHPSSLRTVRLYSPKIQLEFSFIRLLRRLSAQPVHEGRTLSVFYKFRNYVEFGRLVRTGHWRWLEWTYFPQAKQWIANTIENNFHNLFFPS